jgi:hypothetical protein
MAWPNDRGLVVVRDEIDGTKSVFVCAKVVDGAPRHTYATHHHVPHVVVAPRVRLTRGHDSAFTTEIVEVTRVSDGVVSVRYPEYA